MYSIFQDPFNSTNTLENSYWDSVQGKEVPGPEPKPQPYSLATAGTTPTNSSDSKVNWNTVASNAPQILGAIGAIAGTVAATREGKKDSEIKQVCGRKPLFGKTKKENYQKCVDNYLSNQAAIAQAQAQAAGAAARGGDVDGMSTTKKVLIGVGIFIFIAIIVVLIVVLTRKNKEA